MTMTEIKSLCRPVEGVYCVGSCPYRNNGRPCYLFGELEDGSEGCRGHNGKIFKGLTQTPFCQEFTYWDPEKLKLPQVQEALKKHFSGIPEGRYDVHVVLESLGEMIWI